MTRFARHVLMRLITVAAAIGFAAGCVTTAAQYPQGRFDRQQLDSMLAPIALYPDPLLSHVLMAATYPQEVDEAARWSRARPGLSGDAAVRTSEEWDWDPSVRSLLAFPLVLDTMATHMRWTEDLGQAFQEQPEELMDTVQALRRRAYAAGTLRSTEYVRVIDSGYGIVIEPAVPQSVHVPYYDPQVSYGTWWWPAPPVRWARWPGYVDRPGHGHPVLWGPGTRISSGFFFGDFAWPRREVRVVHVNNYYYRRPAAFDRPGDPGRHIHAPGVWRQDDWRRRGNDPRESRRANDQRPPLATRSVEDRRGSQPFAARPRSAEVRAADAPAGARPPAPTQRDDRTIERNNRNRGDDDGARSARTERRVDPTPGERRDDAGAPRAARGTEPPRAEERTFSQKGVTRRDSRD